MACTPGLKIKECCLVRKTRRLPVVGKTLVEKGDIIDPETTVAETELPGNPVIINAAFQLNIDEERLPEFMLKKIGENVNEGEIIAKYSEFWGLVKKVATSPIKGTLELVSDVSGQVVIREAPIRVGVKSYIPGIVTKILPNEGAIIETPAAFMQGIFGIGGETSGKIMVLSESDEILKADKITSECAGKIIVIKTSAVIEALRKAIEVGAVGVISGGINVQDLIDLMGYELGVAITGREKVGLTLIITEGFGEKMKMSDKTFELFIRHEGKLACINGATQIRAGVVRPEIIVPQTGVELKGLVDYDVEDTEAYIEGLMPGTPIRVIGDPYFGMLGRVTELPPELELVETESSVRILHAELEDGRQVTVPRANVEILGN